MPSPSPDLLPAKLPSPERMGASSRNKGPKRRQKTQPSQGDAVLISFLGGLNVPDVAIRAGEEPLNSASQSEVEDLADSMNEEDESAVVQQNSSLVQAAQDALPLVGGIDKTTENSNDILTSNGSKRRLSKLHTQGLLPPSNAKVSNVSPLIMREGCPNDQVIPKPQATLSSATDAYTRGQSLVTSDSCSPDAKWARSDSPASSPLRKHLISASERSPLEMLPALQSSPPSLSNKSPNSPQTLPPLKAHLGHSYMERDIRNDKNRHGGINPGRQPIPMLNGAVHSPTLASAASSSNQYSRPSSLLNSHLPPPYASTQTSPASPYSETSPREPYRVSQGPRSRSPPSIYDSKQLHPNGCTLQVDKLPPLSANGCSNATKLGSDSSPIVGNSNIETGRPVLSLETAPLTTAPFKCEVPGCTALPFQTQYLLK